MTTPQTLEVDRRAALHDLIALLTEVVTEAQMLTTAALRFDLSSLAEAGVTLAELSASPILDLGRTNEIYHALRRAVVERPPGLSVAPPIHSVLEVTWPLTPAVPRDSEERPRGRQKIAGSACDPFRPSPPPLAWRWR